MTDPSVTASTAHVGVVVADASTRTPVYVRDANTPLAPASTQKTFTAAAAMYTLGSGYRWRTDVVRAVGPRRGSGVGAALPQGRRRPDAARARPDGAGERAAVQGRHAGHG